MTAPGQKPMALDTTMSQQSAERPQSEAVDPEQLSDDGAGLGMGEKNTFEPEEEPDAEVEADPEDT